MATGLAVFLHRFLTSHLAGLHGCSPNTIASYRDTFRLLIAFFRDDRSIPPDKLTLDLIKHRRDHRVPETAGGRKAQQHLHCNQRLAAMSSFYRWLQLQDPARMASCQTSSLPRKKPGRA